MNLYKSRYDNLSIEDLILLGDSVNEDMSREELIEIAIAVVKRVAALGGDLTDDIHK